MTRYADLSSDAQADLDGRIDEALGSSLWRYSEDADRIRDTFVNTLSEQLTQLDRALAALSEPARDCLARVITRIAGPTDVSHTVTTTAATRGDDGRI